MRICYKIVHRITNRRQAALARRLVPALAPISTSQHPGSGVETYAARSACSGKQNGFIRRIAQESAEAMHHLNIQAGGTPASPAVYRPHQATRISSAYYRVRIQH